MHEGRGWPNHRCNDCMRVVVTAGEELLEDPPAILLLPNLLVDVLSHLLEDGDPFVRRKAAESLGSYPDAVAAAALVGFLEQSKQRNEWPGEVAAQKALQRIAGTSGLRTAAAWRRFADELRGGSE